MVEKTSLYRYRVSKNHQDVRTWTCIHLKGRNSAHFIFSEKKKHVKNRSVEIEQPNTDNEYHWIMIIATPAKVTPIQMLLQQGNPSKNLLLYLVWDLQLLAQLIYSSILKWNRMFTVGLLTTGYWQDGPPCRLSLEYRLRKLRDHVGKWLLK